MERRSFVTGTGAFAGITIAQALQPSRILGANDKVNIAGIGIRSQGNGNIMNFIDTGRTNIVSLCDVDRDQLEDKAGKVAEKQGRKPKTTAKYQDVLEDPEVDAVMIATPDHWHAHQVLEAIAAGKDVYIEKPCAHNVHECVAMAAAAQKHGRIIQHGTQQRSGKHFQEAKEIVLSGDIGKVVMCRNWAILGRGSIGKAQPSTPPANIDYDAWLGPAPKKPYTDNRCHYNWRFMWDYGTGDMGNWGVHWLDIALWTLEIGWPRSVSSQAGMFFFDDDKETPDTQTTLYEYDDLSVVWELRMWSRQGIHGRNTGTAFYGTQGTLVVDRGGFEIYNKDGSEVIERVKSHNNSSLDHKHDFLDAIRDRSKPIADIESGHISAAVAILGNTAYWADEKVRYNSKTNTLADASKTHLLTREYRAGYDLPVV